MLFEQSFLKSFKSLSSNINMSNSVNVKEIDRKVLLEALWERSKESYFNLHMGIKLNFDSKKAIELERSGGQDGRGHVDYFLGRLIKANIFGEGSSIDPRFYDDANGDGAFKQVVENIKKSLIEVC